MEGVHPPPDSILPPSPLRDKCPSLELLAILSGDAIYRVKEVIGVKIKRKKLGYAVLVGGNLPPYRYYFAFSDGKVFEVRGEESPTLFEVDYPADLVAVVECSHTGCAQAFVLCREVPPHFVNIAEVAEVYDNTTLGDLEEVREKYGAAPWAPCFLEPRVIRVGGER